MCEVALVANIKAKVSGALNELKAIMGQIASSHHHQQHNNNNNNHNNNSNNQQQTHFSALNRKQSTYKSKKHYKQQLQFQQQQQQHNNEVQHLLGKDELALLRESIRRGAAGQAQRPVTISEIGNQQLQQKHIIGHESNLQASKLATHAQAHVLHNAELDSLQEISTIATADSSLQQLQNTPANIQKQQQQQPIIQITNTDGGGTVIRSGNEFYTVGDGYHKTDTCYYHGPNGKFYKFPSDSYHKMTDGCFQRRTDGTFMRLKPATLKCPSSLRLQMEGGATDLMGSHGTCNAASGVSHVGSKKLKQQMLKFIRRSKSHTPATMKELQQEKQLRLRPMQQKAMAADHTRLSGVLLTNDSHVVGTADVVTEQRQKNKVVVTMIENGGLPIVATSKSSKRATKINRVDAAQVEKSAQQQTRKMRISKESVGKTSPLPLLQNIFINEISIVKFEQIFIY